MLHQKEPKKENDCRAALQPDLAIDPKGTEVRPPIHQDTAVAQPETVNPMLKEKVVPLVTPPVSVNHPTVLRKEGVKVQDTDQGHVQVEILQKEKDPTDPQVVVATDPVSIKEIPDQDLLSVKEAGIPDPVILRKAEDLILREVPELKAIQDRLFGKEARIPDQEILLKEEDPILQELPETKAIQDRH